MAELTGPVSATGPLTHRRVLRIAVPIVLANATVPILGAVDTGVVGQLGDAAAIGAVGVGAIVITSVFWIFAFLRMGTTGLVAQAHGARDVAESGAILMRALIIAFSVGLALIALQMPLIAGAFMLAPASAEVEELARGYLIVRFWGAPATIGVFALTGWLIATERTRAVLGLQLWINGLNIALDLWFVLGLGWGVQGVAIATIISEWSGLVLGLWLCRAAFGGAAWRDWPRVFDRARIRRMIQVNTDIMLRTILLKFAMISFVFIGAGFGDVTLASNQVLLQFLHISSHAMDGFAFAAESLVGQAVGARSVVAMRRAARLSSIWGAVMAGGLALAYLALGPWLIDVMAKEAQVQATARAFLPWVALATLMSMPAYMLDGIFIGATETRAMRNTMLISAVIYGLTVAALLPLIGNHGLWVGINVLNLTRAAGLGLCYPGLERRIRGRAPEPRAQ